MQSSYDPYLRQRRAARPSESSQARENRRYGQSSSSLHHARSGNNNNNNNNPPFRILLSEKWSGAALLTLALSGLGLWYTTPISDIITTTMVEQIPLDADVALGQAAARNFNYRDTYDPYWSPLLQEIGRDLVVTLEERSSLDDILRRSAKESASLFKDSQYGGLIQDAASFVQDLVQQISPQPHRNNRRQYYQWNFGIIQADMVNAFALPGGTIRVTHQLLQQLQPTRGELASLLGHEMGHVVWRHSQRRVVQGQLWQWFVKALTYEDGDDDRETFGEALGELLLRSAHWLGQQQFSRQDEYQADATAWALLEQSQLYHPVAIQSLLRKLLSLGGGGGSDSKAKTGRQEEPRQQWQPSDWLSTHPATQDRIQALEEKWNRDYTRHQQRAWNQGRIR